MLGMLETMAFGVAAVVVLLCLDFLFGRLFRRSKVSNAALRVVQAGRVFALFLVAATLASACRADEGMWHDVRWMITFGLTALVAIEVAVRIGLLVMKGLAAGLDSNNLAAAVTVVAHVVAVGVLAAAVFGGRSYHELALAVASFSIAQATLLVLLWLFRWLTSYDDREQILAGNLAAALSHGGLTVALALLIAYATDGEYVGALPALRDYGLALAEGLVVYPLRQVVVQCLVLRSRPTLIGGELDCAIGDRADIGAGAMEAFTYLAAALFVRGL